MNPIKRANKKIGFWLTILVIILISIYFLGAGIKVEQITDFIKRTGFWAPVVFIVLTALTYIFAPISGTPLWFAGYILFGSRFQIYTCLAAIFAAGINFWIARKLGRRWVIKLMGAANMEKVDAFTKDYGLKSLILLRLFVGNFHDFISYAYGLTNIRFISYMLVSLLSPVPWILLWQLYIFKKIDNFGEFTFWSGVTLLPLLVVSSLFLAKGDS